MGHILGDPDLGVQGSTTNSSTIIPGELSQNMMDEKRVDAASVVINQAGLWVTGGRNFKDENDQLSSAVKLAADFIYGEFKCGP